MAIEIKHKFQSAQPDLPDASMVRPSNWNDTHNIEMLGQRLLGRGTAGTGTAQEISLGAGLQWDGLTIKAVLGKADVGLGNVDNTSDASKPVSTAQANAIENIALNSGPTTMDPNSPTSLVHLTNHANTPNSSYYWHIITTFYSIRLPDSNVAQIAVQYNGGSQVYARSRYGASFTPWVRMDNPRNASGQFIIDTPNGNMEIGPANASYCHINTDRPQFYFYKQVVVNGDITANSDARLKTDIRTIDNALDRVLGMRGVFFKKNGEDSTGVIAQEVREHLPEAVKEGADEDKILSVAYGNMVGVLIEAIKELKAEIEELKATR